MAERIEMGETDKIFWTGLVIGEKPIIKMVNMFMRLSIPVQDLHPVSRAFSHAK